MYFLIVIGLCVGFTMGTSQKTCPEFCKCMNDDVYCSGENITEIPKAFPADTRHLEISNTRIVNATLDANMPNLNFLSVKKNRFLQQFFFNNSYDKLASIWFDHNTLKYIECEYALNSVLELQVRHNELTSVTWVVCEFKRVITLNLDNNNLVSFNISLHEVCMPSLNTLHLNYNNITAFNVSTLECQNLTTLTIKSNRLTSFAVQQRVMLQLTGLHLQQNKITFFDCSGGLENLQTLNLEDNHLRTFNPALCKFTRLSFLLLSGNLLEYFNFSSPGLQTVSYLWINGNRLSVIDSSTFDMPRLRALRIGGYQANAYFNISTNMESVRLLDLDGMNIPELDLSGMSSLRTLYISSTSIRMLNVSTLPHLTNLYASHSHLQTIIYNESSPNSFKVLELIGSSIVCDCYLLPLLRGETVHGNCGQPEELSHMRLKDVGDLMRSTCSIRMIPSSPSTIYNSVETYETPFRSPTLELRCTQANDRSTSLSASVYSMHMFSSTSLEPSRTTMHSRSFTTSSSYFVTITASGQALASSQLLTPNLKTTDAPQKESSPIYKYALIATASLLLVFIVITLLLSFKLRQKISKQHHPYVEPSLPPLPQRDEPLRVDPSDVIGPHYDQIDGPDQIVSSPQNPEMGSNSLHQSENKEPLYPLNCV